MTGAGNLAYRDTALKGLVAGGDVVTGNGVLHSIEALNLDAAVGWLQVFDAADHTHVTLGTTVPNLSFEWAASADRHIDDLDYGFNLGLVFAVTTTDGGSTGATTGFDISATYGPR